MPPSRSTEGLALNAADIVPPPAKGTSTDKNILSENQRILFVRQEEEQHRRSHGGGATDVINQQILSAPHLQNNYFELGRNNGNGIPHATCGIVGNNKLKNQKFPMKLMIALSTADYNHIISWTPEGDKFTVHNSKALVDQILPKYFKQCKFSSFLRKLYRWGFAKRPDRRNGEKIHTSTYFHPKFRKGCFELCDTMSCRSGAGSAAEAMHNYWMSGVGFPRDGHISNTLSSQGHSYHYHQPATSTRSRPYLAAPMASVNNLYNSYSNRNDLVVGPMNPSMSSRNAEDDTSIHDSSSAVYQHRQYHPDSTRFMHTNQNFPNEYVGMRSSLVGSINMQGSFHPQTNWPATMPSYPRSHNHHNSTIMTNGNTDHDGKYGNPSATSEAKPYDPHQHSSV